MPRTESVYTERLTIKVTEAMMADLNNVATKSGATLSAVVRQAIRNYLDDTDLTLGTRRRFDRRFRKRLDTMERDLKESLSRELARMEQELNRQWREAYEGGEYRMRSQAEQALEKLSKRILAQLDELAQQRGRGLFG